MLAWPVSGLLADFSVAPNGTLYQATVELEQLDRYSLYDTGVLGERVPGQVTGLTLSQENRTVPFNRTDPFTIVFPKGNYTLSYSGTIRDNHLQQAFPKPYNVTISLPPEYDIKNPLIGMISPQGARVTTVKGNWTTIAWDQVRSVEIRFYDPGRETLLYLFGNFWIIVAVVLLFPFLLTWRRRGSG